MSISKNWIVSLVGITASALTVAGALSVARADNFIEIVPARVGTGVSEAGAFRLRVQVQGLGGKIETDDILISTDSLFQMQQSNSFDFQTLASRVYKIGAIEALYKGGNVGVGFRGVSFGEDPDHGYSNLLRTGLYALVNIIQQDGMRVGIRSGYDFENAKNAAGTEVSRNQLTQEAFLQMDAGPWSAQVNAFVGFNTDHTFEGIHEGAGVSARARIYNFNEFLELGASANFSVDHDPLREALGLNATQFTGSVMMDISYVYRDHSN